MSELNGMWNALIRYKPYAYRHGFGPQWDQMITDRSVESALEVEQSIALVSAKYSRTIPKLSVSVTFAGDSIVFASYAINPSETNSGQSEWGKLATETIYKAIEMEDNM